MRRCPKCGRYMNNYVKRILGASILVYTCQCGYNSEESSTGIVYSDRTEQKTVGDSCSRTYTSPMIHEDRTAEG